MDFTDTFESQFLTTTDYISTDLDLNKKLQDTRHALQESISENDQLKEIINKLYNESRVENVATGELLSMVKSPLFRNIPLPRNADNLPLSERAGYVVFYMKFLGFATRKSTEEYHKTKEHLEGIHNSVKSNTTEIVIPRTGEMRVPELDGMKELKRGVHSAASPTPPATPPDKSLQKPTSSKKGGK